MFFDKINKIIDSVFAIRNDYESIGHAKILKFHFNLLLIYKLVFYAHNLTNRIASIEHIVGLKDAEEAK